MEFRRDKSRTRVGVAAGIAAALASAVASLSTPPAAADPYPAIAFPDKGTYHSFCFASGFANVAALVSRARYTMDNNDGVEAQTVVNTLEQACAAATDVKYVLDDLGAGAYGHTGCHSWNANYYCDQWVVRINWSAIQQESSNVGFQARKTLCHETGHTLGADHYSSPDTPDPSNSCMISGLWDSGAAWTRTYGQHHRNHINGWFS
jgi:hypothetical protein